MKKFLFLPIFRPLPTMHYNMRLKWPPGLKAKFICTIFIHLTVLITTIIFQRRSTLYKKRWREMERTMLKFKEKITEKGLSIRTFVEEDSIFTLFKIKVVKASNRYDSNGQ